MSDTPLDPENDSISGGLPAASLPVPYQSPSLERPEPRRIEDLDHPYSAFPWVDLQLAAHPENAAYGLGIRHVRPYALFVFENWQNLNFLDYFAFYLEDLTFPVAEDYVWNVANPQQYLAIPSEFIPEGEVSSYGRVIRIGSGNESTSPVRTLLIKTDRPGGMDKDPGIPWHTGLVMRVEGFPEGSNIGAGDVVGGLWCLIDLYEHIRQNDVIELSWDGVFVQHTVSPAEAAGSGPIRVFVPKSIIDQGGQLGKVTLRFRVHDVVENFSGVKYQYSKPYFLDAELDPSLLEPPIFLVDGEELESRQIDFDTQSGSTFEVIALTDKQFPSPLPRHQIIVTLLGMLEDGTTQTIVLQPVTDKNLGFTFVPVDASIIAQWVGGSFRVSFEWQTAAGVSLGQSGSTTITVVGTKVLMPAPDVSPIELGLIPAGEDITVTLPFYEPHDPGWLESLFITHVPSGGGSAIVYRQDQLAGAQGGTYTVHAAELEQFNGLGHIDIYYETNDGVVHILGGNALTTRRSLMLGAQIGERVADMPAPRLQGAVGNNVNPADVTGSDVLVTFTYLDTQPGDKLHWSCIGSGLGGSANGTLDINGATAGRELPYPVTRDILDKNNNGSLRISYSLERQGPPRVELRSEALNLTVGVGVQLERPVVGGASLFPDQLNPLAVVDGTYVLVKFRPMLATDHIRVDWISADGTGSVAVSAQGNPSTHEVKVPIPSEVIAKGIREGGNRISVQYHFTRGTFPYESDVLDLELLPLTGLPTPTIDGVGDKVLLVLAELNDAARTRIPVWSFIAPNQLMWMIYTGTFADGSIYKEHTYTANLVTPNGVTHGIFPPTPVDKLRLLKDGSRLTIEFWVTLSESYDINSAVLFGVREHTVQALPSTLPAPAFDNRPGATLTIYPLDYENTASVTVKYDGMNGEHVIQLKWLFPDGSEADIPAKNGLAGGRVDFAISQQILSASVGKTIELMYIAMINGSPVDSFEQRLTVQTIRESDLPRVLINAKANGDTLDLNTFTGNATAALAKWRLSITGQRVWITCSATGVTPLEVLSAYDINSLEANNGLANKTVLRTWLAALPNNQEITVSCAVTFDGSTDRSTAVDLPSTTYRVLTAIGELRLPNLVQASGIGASQTLAPLSALNGGTVEVSYDGMLTTDIIKVTMVGNGAAGSPNIPEKNGSVSGTVPFPIPAHAIGVNIGRTNQTFTLQYKVTRNGSPKDSGVVTVTVTPIPVGNMPRPLINNTPAGATLDLNTFVGNAMATLAKWPFSAAGQRVWLICSSANVGDLYVLNGEPISQSEATNGLANKPVLRTWLESVPNGQQIELKAQVTLDGSQTPGRETPFQSTTYKVSQAFQIDRSDMDLKGFAIIAFNWPRNGQDYPGNAATRVPTGGQPPYTYVSRNSAIAQVTSTGKVTGYSNGVTTIDVRDNAGHWLSYNVYVSNVWAVREYPHAISSADAYNWRRSLPGAIGLDWPNGLEHMQKVYGPSSQFPVPYDAFYWVCIDNGVYCFTLVDAAWDTRLPTQIRCLGVNYRAPAWCLQPT